MFLQCACLFHALFFIPIFIFGACLSNSTLSFRFWYFIFGACLSISTLSFRFWYSFLEHACQIRRCAFHSYIHFWSVLVKFTTVFSIPKHPSKNVLCAWAHESLRTDCVKNPEWTSAKNSRVGDVGKWLLTVCVWSVGHF